MNLHKLSIWLSSALCAVLLSFSSSFAAVQLLETFSGTGANGATGGNPNTGFENPNWTVGGGSAAAGMFNLVDGIYEVPSLQLPLAVPDVPGVGDIYSSSPGLTRNLGQGGAFDAWIEYEDYANDPNSPATTGNGIYTQVNFGTALGGPGLEFLSILMQEAPVGNWTLNGTVLIEGTPVINITKPLNAFVPISDLNLHVNLGVSGALRVDYEVNDSGGLLNLFNAPTTGGVNLSLADGAVLNMGVTATSFISPGDPDPLHKSATVGIGNVLITPEPTTLIMAIMSAIMMFGARRRLG